VWKGRYHKGTGKSKLQEDPLKEERSRSHDEDQREAVGKNTEALEGSFNWRWRDYPALEIAKQMLRLREKNDSTFWKIRPLPKRKNSSPE
jgi:hypothetical protein